MVKLSMLAHAVGYLYYERVVMFSKEHDDFLELCLPNTLEDHLERAAAVIHRVWRGPWNLHFKQMSQESLMQVV